MRFHDWLRPNHDSSFGAGTFTLQEISWVLYSTGKYTQYFVITYKGKESEKEYIYICVCVYVCVYIYTHTHIYVCIYMYIHTYIFI